MKLTKKDLSNQVMTVIKGDFRDGDTVERTHTYSAKQFDFLAPFLIVIQDLYKHKNEFKFEALDIRQDIHEFLQEYFEQYTDTDIESIDFYADSWITDELTDCIPHIYPQGWSYPLELLSIHIIRDDEYYLLEKDQSPETITQAQQFVLDWLKEEATKHP